MRLVLGLIVAGAIFAAGAWMLGVMLVFLGAPIVAVILALLGAG